MGIQERMIRVVWTHSTLVIQVWLWRERRESMCRSVVLYIFLLCIDENIAKKIECCLLIFVSTFCDLKNIFLLGRSYVCTLNLVFLELRSSLEWSVYLLLQNMWHHFPARWPCLHMQLKTLTFAFCDLPIGLVLDLCFIFLNIVSCTCTVWWPARMLPA